MPAESRAAYVGHELDDEHHAAYSRALAMEELLGAVKKLDWGLKWQAKNILFIVMLLTLSRLVSRISMTVPHLVWLRRFAA